MNISKRIAFLFLSLTMFFNIAIANAQDVKITDEQAHKIVYEGTPDDVKKLIQSGYDVNKVYQCSTLLISAIKSGGRKAYVANEPFYTLEKVKILIDAGADVNVYPCPDESMPPLFWAISIPSEMISTGNFIFEELVEKQIDSGVGFCDNLGLMPKPCKDVSEQDKKQIRAFIRKGIDELIRVSKSDLISVIEILVNNGADINGIGINNRTPLHQALINHHDVSVDIIKYLVEKGANVNAQDVYGYTPLFMAFGSKNKNAVDMLIKLGADTNIRSNNGSTYKDIGEAVIESKHRFYGSRIDED